MFCHKHRITIDRQHLAGGLNGVPKGGAPAARAHAGGAVPVVLCWHRRQAQALQVEHGGAGLAAQQVALRLREPQVR